MYGGAFQMPRKDNVYNEYVSFQKDIQKTRSTWPEHEEECLLMAKKGMRRYKPGDIHGGRNHNEDDKPKNDVPPVPEIQGKAKHGNKKAGPM